MYEDFGSQSQSFEVPASSDYHCLFPSVIEAQFSLNISGVMTSLETFETSSLVGQMSLKKTSFPLLSFPIGSVSKSMSTLPAKAQATTNGGDARQLALVN